MLTIFTQLEGCIPVDWSLVPVNGSKKPADIYTGKGFRDWQNSRLKLADLLSEPRYVQAIGVLTGPASNGLLVIDIDSKDGRQLLEEITGSSLFDFPVTICCTSGKKDTQKLFFNVPEMARWGDLRTAHPPGLDVLWSGCQAVMVGKHPTTGSYRWLKGCSPSETGVADAPDWLVDALVNYLKPKTKKRKPLDSLDKPDDKQRSLARSLSRIELSADRTHAVAQPN
jgi:hypothetical protein